MYTIPLELFFPQGGPPIFLTLVEDHKAVAMHSHEFFEVVFIMHGSCLHSGSQTSGILTAGDVLMLPPGHAHAYVATNSTWLYNCLFLPSALTMLTPNEPLPALFSSPARIKTDPSHRQELILLLERIKLEQDTRDKGWERMVLARFTELMVLLERCQAAAPKLDQSSPHYRELMRVISFIEDNVSRELTLEELACVGQLSPSHLTRQFKLVTGMAPVEYWRCFRIARAGELLKEPDATVTGVAQTMGFSDISVFSRQFKQITGMSPTEFRRNL